MGGKKRCICRRSAGGGRRPFAGMKLLPEGRSLVGRGRTLTKTKASSGCRWHEKGTEIIYFFLLSVCILIICAGPYAGFGTAFLAVLFILRPDGKTVRAESAVHAARRARCFGVHFRPTKDVCGLALQETSLPCVTCRRYSDRAPEAPSYVLFYKRTGAAAAVCFRFGRAALATPFALILAVQSSAFAACPYFYSGNAVPPFGFPFSYYAGVHTETPAGSCAPQGGLCADSYVFFARLTSAFRAKPVLPFTAGGRCGMFHVKR